MGLFKSTTDDESDAEEIELEFDDEGDTDEANDGGGSALKFLLVVAVLAIVAYVAYRRASGDTADEFTDIELETEESTTVE